MTRETILNDLGYLITDLQDAFAESLEKLPQALELYPGVRDGYFRSHLIRAGVRSFLQCSDYVLGDVANTGIEIYLQGAYCIKVVRSSHAGDVPAPTTVTRATWCMTNQPRLFTDGVTPDDMWDLSRLRAPGCQSKKIVKNVYMAQDDGLVHLLVDWEEVRAEGSVRLALSLPTGAWTPGETPRVAWRCVLEASEDGLQTFVPSDELFNVFSDEEQGDEGMGVGVG